MTLRSQLLLACALSFALAGAGCSGKVTPAPKPNAVSDKQPTSDKKKPTVAGEHWKIR
jgi:hypothetical protein